jgi:hypothetical protein
MTGDPLEAVAASLGLDAPVLVHVSGGSTASVRERASDGILFLCVGSETAEDGSLFVSPVATEPVVGLGGGGDGWCACGPLPARTVDVRADAATAMADRSRGIWLVVASRADPVTVDFVDDDAVVVGRRHIAPPRA